MSAKNQVISGDYNNCVVVQSFGQVHIMKGFKEILVINNESVDSYEVIDETKVTSASSAIIRGGIGAVFLGPIGALAAVSAKKKGTYVIAILFKDGKRSLLEVDGEIYKTIMINCFEKTAILNNKALETNEKINNLSQFDRSSSSLNSINSYFDSTTQGEVFEIDSNVNIETLLKRIFIFIEDGDWKNAHKYSERVLDQDPENALAYLGKLMSDLNVKKQDDLKYCENPFEENNNYKKVIQYGDENLTKEIKSYVLYVKEQIEKRRLEKIYNDALLAMNSANNEQSFLYAAGIFKKISGYLDSDTLIEECKINAEVKRKDKTRQEKKKKKIAIASIPIIAIIIAFTVFLNNVIIPESKYNQAKVLLEQGEYLEARNMFVQILGYEDSAIYYDNLRNINIISEGSYHTVGLKKDGTVVATGRNEYGETNVSEWRDIVAISAGCYHTVGVKKDGTVVAVGSDSGDVSGWQDIVAVSAGWRHTIGLKKDGTVVATGMKDHGQTNVSGWQDIVSISAGELHTVGLKRDGTVVAVGSNVFGQTNVSGWRDIVAISAGGSYTVGLKKDGKVVAVGSNQYDITNVSRWRNIVEISVNSSRIVGLKKNGTVVENAMLPSDISRLKGIVAISAGSNHTIGLKKDGKVIAVRWDGSFDEKISRWSDIGIPK